MIRMASFGLKIASKSDSISRDTEYTNAQDP